MQLNLRYKFLFNYLNKKIPPLPYQILKLGDYFICSRDINFDVTKKAISTTGTCGISKILEIAKIKTISEFVEREAFKNSDVNSSTGFAAYPFIFNQNKASKYAKLNAFNEMIERYALYRWACNDNIKISTFNLPYKYNSNFYSAIQKEIIFLEYYKIIPSLLNIKDIVLIILYAKTEYGWAFGSAASKDIIQAEQNALKELYMHCVGLYRIKKKQIAPTSNYEKQLIWISQQETLIQTKINSSGKNPIQIPNPRFKNIKTEHNDCYIVEQCYFPEYKQDLSNNKIDKLYL